MRAILTTVVVGALVCGSATPARAQAGQPLAPELTGLGTGVHMEVTTEVARAQRFFDQGLKLLYAFNHAESRRAFEEAARFDPDLAMAYWGIALTHAPNLNQPMTPEMGRAAFAAIGEARARASRVSARERQLIDALSARFADDPAAPRPPLDAPLGNNNHFFKGKIQRRVFFPDFSSFSSVDIVAGSSMGNASGDFFCSSIIPIPQNILKPIQLASETN